MRSQCRLVHLRCRESLAARGDYKTLAFDIVRNPLSEGNHQLPRNFSIIWRPRRLARNGSEVGSRPHEPVHLINHDPASTITKAKMPPHFRGDFKASASGRTLFRCNWSDNYSCSPSPLLCRKHDHDRSIRASLIMTLFCLMRPQIDVGKDISRLGSRP